MGSGSSPLSFGVFFSLPLLQAFLLLVAGHVLPLLPFLAWLVYLQFCEGFLSSPLWCSGHPTIFATCLCCSYCLLLSFSLFFSGWGQYVQVAMLIWPRVVCGSATYHLAHLMVRIFPSRLCTGIWWQPGGPPGFSV
jgi:hypothetical protein